MVKKSQQQTGSNGALRFWWLVTRLAICDGKKQRLDSKKLIEIGSGDKCAANCNE